MPERHQPLGSRERRSPPEKISPWMNIEEWYRELPEGDRGNVKFAVAAFSYSMRPELLEESMRLFDVGETAIPVSLRQETQSMDIRLVLREDKSPRTAHDFYLLQEKIEAYNTAPRMKNVRQMLGELRFDSELSEEGISHAAIFRPVRGHVIRILLPNEFSKEEERSIDGFVSAKVNRFKKLKSALRDAKASDLDEEARHALIRDAYIVPILK